MIRMIESRTTDSRGVGTFREAAQILPRRVGRLSTGYSVIGLAKVPDTLNALNCKQVLFEGMRQSES
jgi:hypothetical protein